MCTSGTLAGYYALPAEGCQIGPNVVSSFMPSTLSPLAMEIDPVNVGVTPLTDPNNGGFRLEYNSAAGPGVVLQSTFQFLVMPVASAATTSASLRLIGASPMGDDAVITGVADVCFGTLNAGVCSASSESLVTASLGVLGGDGQLFDTRSFAPFTTASVLFDTNLDAFIGGSATLSGVELRFQSVPEPSTLSAVLGGALAVLLLRRLRQ